ncbi:hypothetical protein [Glycomyces sp. NPDC047010]|uniref:hypothetical protein n=1 Tax=Glycomyces sp. NPDC047010 TaxID=3155023 RepID=UPI0033DFC82B
MPEIDVNELRSVGDTVLPAMADDYDGFATEIGDAGSGAASILLPDNQSSGNALSEAWVEAHKFLYAVLEENADSHRAAGMTILECCDDYEAADAASAQDFEVSAEDLESSYTSNFEKTDAGEYESELAPPVDGQDYDITAGQQSYGDEMTEWAEQQQQQQANG